jgi:hypothetical protein
VRKDVGPNICVCPCVNVGPNICWFFACAVGTFGRLWKVFDRSERWLVRGPGVGHLVYKGRGRSPVFFLSSRDFLVS